MIISRFKGRPGLLIALALALGLVLSACGDNTATTAPAATTVASAATTAAATATTAASAATTAAATATTVAATTAATSATTAASAATTAAGTAATTAAAAAGNAAPLTAINIKVPDNLKTGPGVDKAAKTIKVGAINPLSGTIGPFGKNALAGLETYFKALNDAGGIGGYKVSVVAGDSAYQPQQAVQQYNKLAPDVAMFAQIYGTPIAQALKESVANDKILSGAVTFDSSIIPEKYMYLPATPYPTEVINGMDYMINKGGKKGGKFVLVFQDDGYGADVKKGYDAAIKAYGITDAGQIPFKVTDTSFTAQATQLKTLAPDVVVMASQPTQTAGIVGAAAQLGVNTTYLMLSPAFNPALLGTPLKDLLVKSAIVVSKGVPWGDPSAPGEARKLTAVAKYIPEQKPDGGFSLGWNQGIIAATALGKALENGDITREGLLKGFETIKDLDLGGSLPPVTYGSTPDLRIPSRESTIFKVDADKPDGVTLIEKSFASEAAKAYKLS